MAVYNISRNNFTTSVTDDSLTIVTAASGVGSRPVVYEVFIGGMNGSSSLSNNCFARSTGGTTPGGAITPTPFDSNSSATLGFSVPTTWAGGQPTLGTSFVLCPTLQGNGGQYKWWAVPGKGIIVGTGAAVSNLSFRALNNTSTMSIDIKVELP
jgi:hypothetical protein